MTVAWSECCFQKKNGGLGLKSFSVFNATLLSKLAWMVMTMDSLTFGFLRARFKRKFNRSSYLTSFLLAFDSRYSGCFD